jgi:beta-lactamase regulating signal transducer with metallopeptidase domain
VLAASLYVWWSARIVSGIRMVGRTIFFSRACRLGGDRSEARAHGAPLVTVSGRTRQVALVGLLRPFILISESLIDDGGLDPLALQVVLDHERSHAAQHDNWKLLSLHCLPRLNLRLPGRKTWMQHWQTSAEWAADDDAVGGNSARALMLAETLVALARTHSTEGRQIACTYLVCEDTELALRVERLLHRIPDSSLTRFYKTGLALGSVALCATAVLAAFSSIARDLPEQLLHLG